MEDKDYEFRKEDLVPVIGAWKWMGRLDNYRKKGGSIPESHRAVQGIGRQTIPTVNPKVLLYSLYQAVTVGGAVLLIKKGLEALF